MEYWDKKFELKYLFYIFLFIYIFVFFLLIDLFTYILDYSLICRFGPPAYT